MTFKNNILTILFFGVFFMLTTTVAHAGSGVFILGGYEKGTSLSTAFNDSADCYDIEIGGKIPLITLVGGYKYCAGLSYAKHNVELVALLQSKVDSSSIIGFKPYIGGGVLYSYLEPNGDGSSGADYYHGPGFILKGGIKINIKFIVLSLEANIAYSLLESTRNVSYGEFDASLGSKIGFVF